MIRIQMIRQAMAIVTLQRRFRQPAAFLGHVHALPEYGRIPEKAVPGCPKRLIHILKGNRVQIGPFPVGRPDRKHKGQANFFLPQRRQ